jgi:aldehyde dehydrogenase (NAD+)
MRVESFDPDTIAIPGGHFIGGISHDPRETELEVRRPSDGAIYAHLPDGDADLVDRAVQDARRAFRASGWAWIAPRDRARILTRWAELIERDASYLSRLEALGSTRPVRDALSGDVPYVADVIRFFAEFADKWGGEVAATRGENLGLTISEPYGVIGAIAPWNFPLVMACWRLAPALAAGNAVVLKPSEMTPFSANRLAALAIEAGVPPGIFNVVQGRGATVGDAICRHPDVAKVTFTGSTKTGAMIMANCAIHGTKPVTLELGGKSPQIVFADAPHIGKTADMIARAIAGNAGQVCIAGARLIVEEHLAPRLIDGIAAAFSALRPGATWEAETTLPPIISERQCARIANLVGRAVAGGAEVLAGGTRLHSRHGSGFFAPTMLGGVAPHAEIIREEVFGPVLTVQTFREEDEAYALAAHPAYGLAAGVHTADFGRTMRAIRRIEAGTVWVNRYGRSSDHISPTGGFKQSGIGKDLGRQAYEGNLRLKSVLMAFEWEPAGQHESLPEKAK